MDDLEGTYRPLLEAVSFAARAHRHQLRKDGQTPYAAHPFRVCLVLRHVFGIDDPEVLTAALLHDTVEDTNTDFDDLHRIFGPRVAGWVALLTKDKRLPDDRREHEYRAGLAAADWQVKACKLADMFDNLMDSRHRELRPRTAARSRFYLEALNDPRVQKPYEIVQSLLQEIEKQLGEGR
jgi:guanosine-3',5'-bis(diphosphate) 3'-pyrophosphohydrolase